VINYNIKKGRKDHKRILIKFLLQIRISSKLQRFEIYLLQLDYVVDISC